MGDPNIENVSYECYDKLSTCMSQKVKYVYPEMATFRTQSLPAQPKSREEKGAWVYK
jgi:hypothetical protein